MSLGMLFSQRNICSKIIAVIPCFCDNLNSSSHCFASNVIADVLPWHNDDFKVSSSIICVLLRPLSDVVIGEKVFCFVWSVLMLSRRHILGYRLQQCL